PHAYQSHVPPPSLGTPVAAPLARGASWARARQSLCAGPDALATTGLALAYGPASRPHPLAERLAQAIVALSIHHQLVDPAVPAQLLHTLLSAASERQQLLATLVEDAPGKVLRVALPADLRASLP